MCARLFIYWLILTLIQAIISGPSCIYEMKNGQKLDVRALGLANGKGPKYPNIPSGDPVPKKFSWNGCFPYSISGSGNCTNAAACFTDTRTGRSTIISTPDVVTFEQQDDVVALIYQYGNLHLLVTLSCRDEDEETMNGNQDSATSYRIIIASRCCCPGKCHYSTHGSLGAGAVLVIIFIVVLFIYIIGGLLFMKYQRGATGLDLIPHRSMWSNLTNNAINGARYSYQVIRTRSLNAEYQKV